MFVEFKSSKENEPASTSTKQEREMVTNLYINLGDDEKEAASETARANEMSAWWHEAKLNILRRQVLFWIYLERFVQLVIVILVTFLAIKWKRLTILVEEGFWPLIIIILAFEFTMRALYRISAPTRVPGCLILKLYYLQFLIAIYLLLAIHVPSMFLRPHLSPYMAMVAAGTSGAIYIYLSITSILKNANARVEGLYKSGMVMPLCALIGSQLVYYFAYYNNTYPVFMINVAGGVLFGFIFSLDTIFYSKKFINSKKLEKVVKTAGVISLAESASIAAFMYRQPWVEEEQVEMTEVEERRDVENM